MSVLPSIGAVAAVLEWMQREVREVNERNGWHEEERTVGDDVALLHSEVSEMLEAYRDTGLEDATDYSGHVARTSHDERLRGLAPKPEGFGSEAADVLIRLLDTCERRGVDLEAEFNRKIRYNRTRGYRHGGKRL